MQASFFPVKQKLEVYGITSQIYGDDDAGFGDSSEYGIGINWYPYPTRNHRLNVQLLDVNKSPVSSTFGYYVGGQDGWPPPSQDESEYLPCAAMPEPSAPPLRSQRPSAPPS